MLAGANFPESIERESVLVERHAAGENGDERRVDVDIMGVRPRTLAASRPPPRARPVDSFSKAASPAVWPESREHQR